jgi:hypothetical protein
VNSLSPSSDTSTNASVVRVGGGWRKTAEVSTPTASRARRMNSPKRSSPNLPTNAVSAPSLAAATATLAGAPPGRAVKGSSTSEDISSR